MIQNFGIKWPKRKFEDKTQKNIDQLQENVSTLDLPILNIRWPRKSRSSKVIWEVVNFLAPT